jgi:ribosomal protein S18 acetylase RimI-like enzyme
MQSLEIKKATSAKDIEKLSELDTHIFPHDAFGEGDWEDLEAFFVTIDNTLVGSIALKHNAEVTASRNDGVIHSPGTLYIASIGLIKQFQKFGLGKVLANWQLSYARMNNFRKISVNMRASNEASINLYKKMGFKEKAVIPNSYQDPREDMVILELRLSRE